MPVSPGSHTRDHRSLLAAAEKRLLVAIARRLPPGVHSDHLSLLALGSMGVVGASFAMSPGPWSVAGVIGGLVANWFGDSLDGTLARVRGHERPRFGYYVDHTIDLAGAAALFAGLACSGLMSPLMATATLAAYLLVTAEVFLATHSTGTFRMSSLGVGPTELRLLLVAGVLSAAHDPFVDVPWLGVHRLFDVGGAVALVGFGWTFLASAVRHTRTLYAREPLPGRAPVVSPLASGLRIQG